jgi:glycosyltransferase involved in cell wall biosynthesis
MAKVIEQLGGLRFEGESEKMQYVIITPAHNEEKFIEKTICSMMAQTVRPFKWIVVNDGSTDRTKEIVESYLSRNEGMELLNIDRGEDRSFENKAKAFNLGVRHVKGAEYEFIGNLDADMVLDPDYYFNILQMFLKDPKLGVCGGIVYTTVGSTFVTTDQTLNSVGGAVQLFRRECFTDIGAAYMPLPYGGIDAAAEITAKMKGWTVRKSLENKVYEQRQTGTAISNPLVACYRLGCRFHSLGYGLVFFGLRCLYRIGDPPSVLGSCATFLGFASSMIKGRPVLLPEEVVEHWKREQRSRLYGMLFSWKVSKTGS